MSQWKRYDLKCWTLDVERWALKRSLVACSVLSISSLAVPRKPSFWRSSGRAFRQRPRWARSPDLRRRELQQKLREIWSARMFGCAKGRADRDRRDGNPGVARYDVSRGPSRPAQRARSYLR